MVLFLFCLFLLQTSTYKRTHFHYFFVENGIRGLLSLMMIVVLRAHSVRFLTAVQQNVRGAHCTGRARIPSCVSEPARALVQMVKRVVCNWAEQRKWSEDP